MQSLKVQRSTPAARAPPRWAACPVRLRWDVPANTAACHVLSPDSPRDRGLPGSRLLQDVFKVVSNDVCFLQHRQSLMSGCSPGCVSNSAASSVCTGLAQEPRATAADTMQKRCTHLEEEAHVVAQLLLVVEVWRLQPAAGHHLQQVLAEVLCSSREEHAAS